IASTIWLLRDEDGWQIPLAVLKGLAPVAGMFALFNLLSSSLGMGAEITGLVTGLAAGAILARDIRDGAPARRPVSIWAGAILIIVTTYAVFPHASTQHNTDVRPEIDRVLALENYTAEEYDHAVGRFRKGRITNKGLADVIEQTILPALQ